MTIARLDAGLARTPAFYLTFFAVLLVALLAACSDGGTSTVKADPATVEKLPESDLSRVTLAEEAAERLGVETEEVRGGPGSSKAVPYSAVIYDLSGETWVYVNPEPLVFIRARVLIDHIDGGFAHLSEGPEPGTAIVIVGAAELYGAESGVGK